MVTTENTEDTERLGTAMGTTKRTKRTKGTKGQALTGPEVIGRGVWLPGRRADGAGITASTQRAEVEVLADRGATVLVRVVKPGGIWPRTVPQEAVEVKAESVKWDASPLAPLPAGEG